uniref:30S ribosomal protein S16, chloroplastic n=1 Tax=Garcinia oblongifolia TaxID=1009475 RepID=A0A7G5XQU4_9ROSI|nr:ribosomal protein S16 [Garcinia oblongifolia]QNA48149.1 ribosomal protein S16 [Garcinia oblongifolia]
MIKLRLKRCGRNQHEPFIESLQFMFDPERGGEIFRKWVFMIR